MKINHDSIWKLLVVLGCLAVPCAMVVSDEPVPLEQLETKELIKRIESLEARVQALENAIRLGPSRTNRDAKSLVPDHWIPKDYNGTKHYIVPLDVKRGPAAVTK